MTLSNDLQHERKMLTDRLTIKQFPDCFQAEFGPFDVVLHTRYLVLLLVLVCHSRELNWLVNHDVRVHPTRDETSIKIASLAKHKKDKQKKTE